MWRALRFVFRGLREGPGAVTPSPASRRATTRPEIRRRVWLSGFSQDELGLLMQVPRMIPALVLGAVLDERHLR